MARFSSSVAFVVQGKRYKAGQTYADNAANALPGDVVWVGLSPPKMSPGLVPLDASADSMMRSSRFTTIQRPRIDGANSIEG